MLAAHTQEPRVINVDKNADEPKVIDELKADKELSERVELRQNKYLNNRVEQDHRFIKRLTRARHGLSLVQYSPRKVCQSNWSPTGSPVPEGGKPSFRTRLTSQPQIYLHLVPA